LALWIGWIAAGCILLAGLVPLVYRLRMGKRAVPGSTPISLHVALGLGVAAITLVHTLAVLGALGSESAIDAGAIAFAPGAAGFFLLFAHVGVGLRLREPKLRDRASKRRTHVITASLITIATIIHVVALRLWK
jgi:hypothetical protein